MIFKYHYPVIILYSNLKLNDELLLEQTAIKQEKRLAD